MGYLTFYRERYAAWVIDDGRDDDRSLAQAMGFPVDGGDVEPDEDYSGAASPGDDRELTAMEMMGAPKRASESTKRTVLWFSLAFAMLMMSLTVGVMTTSGVDLLTLFTAVALGFVIAAMIGALRYKGEDPMAQFDPPERPKRRKRRRKP